MGRKKIIDEYTNLPVSRQRKWQLRHPEKEKELSAKHRKTLKWRVTQREWARKRYNYKHRRFSAESYRDELLDK